jgi:1-acyl-sn-glycerol-3-phosphate acyltransferase
VRRRLARLILRASRWRAVGQVPSSGIVVAAPHTSNWDYVLMLLVMWNGGVPPRVLVKKEFFRGPLGWFLRINGGIPVDRANPASLVRELVRTARAEPFLLIIAAEGTRKKSRYWKSGFYRIARSTGLPIVLAFSDGPTRTAGFGPTLRPTGDVVADMDQIRAFYADKHGVRPALRTEPRLQEEDRPRPGSDPDSGTGGAPGREGP